MNQSFSVLVFAGFAIGVGCSEGQTAFTGKPDDQHARLNDGAPSGNTQNPPGSGTDPGSQRVCEDVCLKVPIQCRTNDCTGECLDATTGRCAAAALELYQCATHRGSLSC